MAGAIAVIRGWLQRQPGGPVSRPDHREGTRARDRTVGHPEAVGRTDAARFEADREHAADAGCRSPDVRSARGVSHFGRTTWEMVAATLCRDSAPSARGPDRRLRPHLLGFHP